MTGASLAAASNGGGNGLIGFLPVVVIGVVFLLLISRSNRKRQAAAGEVQAGLEPGAQVLTTSGLYATVVAVDDEDVSLEIAPGVVCLFARGAIARVLPDEDDDGEDDDGPDRAGDVAPGDDVAARSTGAAGVDMRKDDNPPDGPDRPGPTPASADDEPPPRPREPGDTPG